MRQSTRKAITTGLKLLVSCAAIWYILRQVDIAELASTFKGSDPAFVLLGLVALVLSQIVSADRLRQTLIPFNIRPDRIWNYKLYFVGMAYNLFLPGGIGGDAYKVILFNKGFGVKKRIVALLMIIDRLSGLEAILVWLVIVIGQMEIPLPYKSVYWVLIPLSLITIYALLRRFLPALLPNTFRILVLAIVVQGIQILSILLLAKALNFEATFTQITTIFLLSSVATTVPVFLGGIGAREAVFGLLALDWSLNEAGAVALGLSFSAITILASVPGLFFDWTLKKQGTTEEV